VFLLVGAAELVAARRSRGCITIDLQSVERIAMSRSGTANAALVRRTVAGIGLLTVVLCTAAVAQATADIVDCFRLYYA
jgi:hypothetical protein